MIGRTLLFGGALTLSACVGCAGPQPEVLPPPAPGNLPRISTQLVCHEVWQHVNGGYFTVVYWKWSTTDGNARVQVQDVTNGIVTKDFIIPANGGEWWQRLSEGAEGRINWESSPGVWKTVALFPANWPTPPKCGWGAPPI